MPQRNELASILLSLALDPKDAEEQIMDAILNPVAVKRPEPKGDLVRKNRKMVSILTQRLMYHHVLSITMALLLNTILFFTLRSSRTSFQTKQNLSLSPTRIHPDFRTQWDVFGVTIQISLAFRRTFG
jgi:hypothetical protein